MITDRSHLFALLLTVATSVVFGLYPASAQAAYADGANIAFVVLITTFCRAIGLVLYCAVKQYRVLPQAGQWRVATWSAFWQAISVLGTVASLAYIPGAITMTIVFTHALLLLLFMAYRGEAQLTRLSVLSTVAALIGVGTLVDVWGKLEDTNIIGLLLALLSAFAAFTRMYAFGKQVMHTNPAVVGAQVLSGAFILLIVICAFQTPVAPSSGVGWMWLSLSCFVLALGTFGMFFGIRMLGSFQYSLILTIQPVFTALFSYLILNEVLRPTQYLGLVIVIASLTIFQLGQKRPTVVATEPQGVAN